MSADKMRLKIAHLYPDVMDLYGDNGNVLAVRRRCEWRGIDVEVVNVRAGERVALDDVDLLVMGGGQDSAQAFVAGDLANRATEIRHLVDEGAAALVVCGGFQLFAKEYLTASGRTIDGIGVFDAWTMAGEGRLIGDVVVETSLQSWGPGHPPAPSKLVGFENHSGRTFLGQGAQPLGKVVFGHLDAADEVEGAVYRNAIGTYLHGPLLPRNPQLADHLIVAALAHRYGSVEPLSSLDDVVEMDAHRSAFSRGLTIPGEMPAARRAG